MTAAVRTASGSASASTPGIAGRLTGRRAAAVWLLAAFDIGLILAPGLLPGFPLIFLPLELGMVAAFGIVGAVLGTQLPRNPIGWILLATATVASLSLAGSTYVDVSVTEFGGELPGTLAVAWLAQYTIIPCVGAVGCFLLLLFPDGHLPSLRWRGVAWLSAVMITAASIVAAVTPGLVGGSGLPNPLGATGLGLSADELGLISAILLAIPCIAAIASVFLRYRGARTVERQQLRLLGLTGIVLIVLMWLGGSSIGPLADYGWILYVVGLGLVPVAVGTAILRYRLYDIDRIVSRTISWAVVTAIPVGVFAFAIVGLQAVLAPFNGNNTLAVAGSTLLAAALFQPLRRRVQHAVDRRFNRSGDFARLAVEAFAGQLRDEVALDAVSGRLLSTAGLAVQPRGAGLWLRSKATT